MKKAAFMLAMILIFSLFTACNTDAETETDNRKIRIVATMFPEYDFSRHVAGDLCQVSMLLPPGSESHSYEPTPNSISSIKKADVFIYGGGESDTWLKNIIEDISDDGTEIISLMDICELKEEEIVEGMESEEEHGHSGEHGEEEPEYDEHVWTSPKNAALIVRTIYERLGEIDPANAGVYRKNAESYIEEINGIDEQFRLLTESAKRKTIVFGDRFPFRYFADEYNLDYFAAFPGCSEDTEPGAKTMKFLIDKVRSESIPVVFKIEFSNGNAAEAISAETGAKVLEFNSCHNVSSEQLESGESYVAIMRRNLENLRSALN